MLSRFISIFSKEVEVPLLEYGTTANEVLANYVNARDYGQSQKAYTYLSTQDKKNMSFSKFLEALETNPYMADTVEVINHRSKNQKFETVIKTENNATVCWVIDFSKLYATKKQLALEMESTQDNTNEDFSFESNIQRIEFNLIKEYEYWKVQLSDY
ncbi:MAG: hypothetical protein HRU38_14910 [Saccharospirillaceae bacterium]|nr:hypothetical protein [Pseudomonadales bacterium]NRB79932.1 hypothetical protein [Saccharospirillaceae bacterium]